MRWLSGTKRQRHNNRYGQPALSSKIELHDSAVEKFSQENDCITLTFSAAYIHKSEGKPGIDPGTGWWQPLRMRFEAASYSGTLPDFPEEINTGILTINGQSYDNMLPTTLEAEGEIKLYLLFWMNGKYEFAITAQRVVLTLLGEAEYVEEFPGMTTA